MASSRDTLPNRRASETFEFEAGVPGEPLQHYIATVGFFPDWRVGEIFLHATKTGSDRDIAVSEAAIAISFALQFGAPIDALRGAMPRTSGGQPEGPIGTLLDLLAKVIPRRKVEAAE